MAEEVVSLWDLLLLLNPKFEYEIEHLSILN